MQCIYIHTSTHKKTHINTYNIDMAIIKYPYMYHTYIEYMHLVYLRTYKHTHTHTHTYVYIYNIDIARIQNAYMYHIYIEYMQLAHVCTYNMYA